jgi:hypothetical protein
MTSLAPLSFSLLKHETIMHNPANAHSRQANKKKLI